MKKHLIDYVEWEGYWCKACRSAVRQGDLEMDCQCFVPGNPIWIPARFWLAVVNPGAPGNTSSPWPDLTDYGECGIIHPTIHRGDVHDPS